VAADGRGNWIVVWHSDEDFGNPGGGDRDILSSRSEDGGLTWSSPIAVNKNWNQDLGDDYDPDISTDRAGRWIAMWASNDNFGGTLADDYDAILSYSIDNGASWTPPTPLNSNAASDVGVPAPGLNERGDFDPHMASDSQGQWVAVWFTYDDLSGTIGTDGDIVVAAGFIGLLDTDQDLLPDAVETNTGTFVDSTNTGTNPNIPDTDGDGVIDGIEVALGTDPNDGLDFPTLPLWDAFEIFLIAALLMLAIRILIPIRS